MNLIIPLSSLADAEPAQVGSKAFNLGAIFRKGLRVPDALCITQGAYETYVRSTGLMERISLELGRKDFRDMRWEELWDASLRIRSMFLNTAMPAALVKKVRGPIEEIFGERPVAVRSSAPGEDPTTASFAGLHDSYLNVKGIYSILDHIRLVWASLWSDSALLYRKELDLDVHHSTMAVIIQELIAGQKSGVILSQAPADESHAIIEAIYGLNQGFVDGIVEPDRWTIDRTSGAVISHDGAFRDKVVNPSASGVSLEGLAQEFSLTPVLNEEEIQKVYHLAMRMEELFGSPQDMEWTFDGMDLYTLQSRPIAAFFSKTTRDIRSWYRGISRSVENLRKLKSRIEDELIPEMIEEVESLSNVHHSSLSDDELSGVIIEMTATYQAWERAYWKYFIPFAHGMRLFGRVYNDTVRPHDPYEFMDLMRSSNMLSIQRNSGLEHLASLVRQSPALAGALRYGKETSGFPEFENEMKRFISTFGDLSFYNTQYHGQPEAVRGLVLKLASKPVITEQPPTSSMEGLDEYYLSFFHDERKPFARDLLGLARASYRLRDDDNIYLGRIKGRLMAGLNEGRRRLAGRLPDVRDSDIPKALQDPLYKPADKEESRDETPIAGFMLHARQLVGQPAGSGIATGTARVILQDSDLALFNAGEVIVCDALEPNMTFIMPLASGIVECRGGMLIHGAIIAREYSLPCVTGVPDAVSLIKTGDTVSVDGYLGIVIIRD
jgi:phosphoenolpyruvate synthase/pyruvate phosphate dikinase